MIQNLTTQTRFMQLRQVSFKWAKIQHKLYLAFNEPH